MPERIVRPPQLATASARAISTVPRFTLDGDAGLERHLTTTCERIAAGLRGLLPASRLEGVALGGGYGRGEGGVLHLPDGDHPYNDLEFYVFLRGNRHLNERRHGRALHVFGEILTPQAGIDVEFRITSRPEFARGSVSMFSYDLVRGHRWLIGDESLFAGCEHHRLAEAIPMAEATRLLMNRCTGLLLSLDRLRREAFTSTDADFVARNIAKAQLGAGDAVLTALSKYHWRVTERHRRLERLARLERGTWMSDVRLHHAAGVAFKLHPRRSKASREELAAELAHVSDFCREAWLWLENRRLKARFRSIRDYVESTRSKWPEAVGARSALINAKLFGLHAASGGSLFRHPRERILTSLPLLLWQRDVLSLPAKLDHLQRELHTKATDFSGLVAAYRKIWERLN